VPLDESIKISRIIAIGVYNFFVTTTTTITADMSIINNSPLSNATIILDIFNNTICKDVTEVV